MWDDPEKIQIDDKLHILITPEPPAKNARILAGRGKILYGKCDYNGALNAYSMAISSVDDFGIFSCNLTPQHLSNRAMVYLKLKNYFFAYIDANEAIKLDKYAWKAYYRKGQALEALGFFSMAIDCYDECLKHIPEDDEKSKKQAQKDKEAIKDKADTNQMDHASLSNYHPFDSDPQNFGREYFTGELNRFIWNNALDEEFNHDKITDPKSAELNHWKTIEELQRFFLKQAKKEYKTKNWKQVIYYVDFMRAFSIVQDDWMAPGLMVLRALAWAQLGK
uniref:Uncharacterized protein n=1 Tax=Acrobeloides nanus TaxID=290746 RepID=A0A914CPM9_9BILA